MCTKVPTNENDNLSVMPKVCKSGVSCAVPGCTNSKIKDPKGSFHGFPQEGSSKVEITNSFGEKETIDVRQAWISLLKIQREVSRNMRVCRNHFAEEDFFYWSQLNFLLELYNNTINIKRRCLKRDAVPSRNLPTDLDILRYNTKYGKRNADMSCRKTSKKSKDISVNGTDVMPCFAMVKEEPQETNGNMGNYENYLEVEIKEEPTELIETNYWAEERPYSVVEQRTCNQFSDAYGSVEHKYGKYDKDMQSDKTQVTSCKTYRCQLCDQCFKSRYYRSKHFSTHTSEERQLVCVRHRKYNCKLCEGRSGTVSHSGTSSNCNGKKLKCDAEAKYSNRQHSLIERNSVSQEKVQCLRKSARIKKFQNKSCKYVSSCGRIVEAQAPSEICCNCVYACSKKINKQTIKRLYSKFWKIRDFQKQNSYLFNCIQSVPIKHRYTDAKCSRRQRSYAFKINVNGKEIRLCKKSFLSIHGLNSSLCRVNKILKNVFDNIPPVDRKRRHSWSINCVPKEEVQSVHDHLTLLTGGENPRNVSFTDLNVRYMYHEHYVKYCEEKNILPVSEPKYRQIFFENYIKSI